MNQLDKKKLSLYVHIPFCASKCYYCDFLSGPAAGVEVTEYIKALLIDIRSWGALCEGYRVDTIFIGGGTPSVIDSAYIVDILNEIRKCYDVSDHCEITIEINPGTVERSKFQDYKEAGINRISFGLQSTNNQELKRLGRIHTYEQFLENYSLAREIEFKNINIDLMSALPGQTVADFSHTLERIVALEPEHISAYSLIIEEGTIFYKWYGEDTKSSEKEERLTLPSEEEDRLIYEKTKEILRRYGYERYEISNYSKPGYECKHNCVYWQRGDYLGFGIGAASLFSNLRFHNLEDRKEYTTLLGNLSHEEELTKNNSLLITSKVGENMKWLEDSTDIEDFDDVEDSTDIEVSNTQPYEYILQRDIEALTVPSQMEEFMYLGLRMMKGVKKSTFYTTFGQSIDKIYGEVIEKLKNEKLLLEEGDYIFLSEKGIDLSNVVFSEFLFDE